MTDEEARRRFATARVARLATSDAEGHPHIVPLVFALASGRETGKTRSGDTIYSAVDAKPKRSVALRRLANIAANPRVAVLVDHYEGDWHALWWVRADGSGRILDADESEGRDGIARLVARYPQYREQPPRGPVLAIDVARWSHWSATGALHPADTSLRPGAMHVEHHEGRAGFLDQLSTMLEVCTGLDDERLQAASRCRGWTVGDVLVHVHLGLQEMLLGVVSPTTAEPDTDAAGYWRHELPRSDPAADQVAQVRFVRLLAAAYRRPTGLVAHLRPTADGLATAVQVLAAGNLRFQGHVLGSGDFLATWAVELAVHHLDLQRELDLPPPAPAATRLARRTIESLAGRRLPADWPDETAILIGTGRWPLDGQQAQQIGPLATRLPVLG